MTKWLINRSHESSRHSAFEEEAVRPGAGHGHRRHGRGHQGLRRAPDPRLQGLVAHRAERSGRGSEPPHVALAADGLEVAAVELVPPRRASSRAPSCRRAPPPGAARQWCQPAALRATWSPVAGRVEEHHAGAVADRGQLDPDDVVAPLELEEVRRVDRPGSDPAIPSAGRLGSSTNCSSPPGTRSPTMRCGNQASRCSASARQRHTLSIGWASSALEPERPAPVGLEQGRGRAGGRVHGQSSISSRWRSRASSRSSQKRR